MLSINNKLIVAASAVLGQLGCGFPKTIYVNAMRRELNAAMLHAEKNTPLQVAYKDHVVGYIFNFHSPCLEAFRIVNKSLKPGSTLIPQDFCNCA